MALMRILSILVLLSSFTSLSAQELIYVPYFKCEGCNKQIGVSSALMFKDFVNDKGQFKAEVAQLRDTTAPAEEFNDARESAELMSSKYFIIGKIVRLVDVYYVTTTLYATSSGLQFWQGSRMANSPEDLAISLKYLAGKLAYEKSWSEDGDIYLHDNTQGAKLNRQRSNKGIGVITGAMIPLSEPKINNVNPGFGLQTSFDARNFILEISGEVYFGNDSVLVPERIREVDNRYYNLTINTIYPITRTNSAPFVCLGGGFSYRESDVTTISAQGLENEYKIFDQGFFANGGGGYILNRKSDTPLFIYARGYIFMPKLDVISYGAMLSFAIHIENW